MCGTDVVGVDVIVDVVVDMVCVVVCDGGDVDDDLVCTGMTVDVDDMVGMVGGGMNPDAHEPLLVLPVVVVVCDGGGGGVHDVVDMVTVEVVCDDGDADVDDEVVCDVGDVDVGDVDVSDVVVDRKTEGLIRRNRPL